MRNILSRPRTTVVVGLVTMLTVLIAFAARPTAAPTPKTTVLYTPPLAAGPGSNLLCEVVNVSTTSHAISMELVGNDGVTIGQMPFGGGTLTVAPGQGFDGGQVGPSIGYCRITVDGTSSLDVRGAVAVNDGITAQTIAVAPAF